MTIPLQNSIDQNLNSRGAVARLFNDGRLHLHQGPIDLVIGADGGRPAINKAFIAAARRFDGLLNELVDEIDLLRMPVNRKIHPPRGSVAERMWAVSLPHVEQCSDGDYVTSMAAVAGAVADEILKVMRFSADLERIYVNNGGDIALYLNPFTQKQQEFLVGICADPGVIFQSFTDWSGSRDLMASGIKIRNFAGTIKIIAADQIGGIATSGWRGRSHSLGVADLVTVLSSNAAEADVAATLIANAIRPDNGEHEIYCGVYRQPANELAPDSDLGSQLVTVWVDPLSEQQIKVALERGQKKAVEMCRSGMINAAFGVLQGHGFHCGSHDFWLLQDKL